MTLINIKQAPTNVHQLITVADHDHTRFVNSLRILCSKYVNVCIHTKHTIQFPLAFGITADKCISHGRLKMSRRVVMKVISPPDTVTIRSRWHIE